MADTFEPIVGPRTGRLDLLIKDGFGMLADRFGIRSHAQPVIDEWVDQNIEAEQIPVTPSALLRRLGVLGNPGDRFQTNVRRRRTRETGKQR